jgi:hypothetical protein
VWRARRALEVEQIIRTILIIIAEMQFAKYYPLNHKVDYDLIYDKSEETARVGIFNPTLKS